MASEEAVRPVTGWLRSLVSGDAATTPELGITVYGCGPHEAAVFRELAPRLGVVPVITEAAVSEATVELVGGNRCISVDDRARITGSTLRALSRSGVEYISTRSVGADHIDATYAADVGIHVETVGYPPDAADTGRALIDTVRTSLINCRTFISRRQEWI